MLSSSLYTFSPSSTHIPFSALVAFITYPSLSSCHTPLSSPHSHLSSLSSFSCLIPSLSSSSTVHPPHTHTPHHPLRHPPSSSSTTHPLCPLQVSYFPLSFTVSYPTILSSSTHSCHHPNHPSHPLLSHLFPCFIPPHSSFLVFITIHFLNEKFLTQK